MKSIFGKVYNILIILSINTSGVFASEEDKLKVLSFEAGRNGDGHENYLTLDTGVPEFNGSSVSTCFRILPRYSSGLTIIREMGMIYITISDLEAKYGYIQSTLARIFDLCGPPKLWYSICASFYYNDNRERVRVFHNGKSCLDKVFIDEFGDEPIRFRQNVTLGIDKPGFTGRHAYGKVADFNLWNRSLSSEEMKYFTIDCHKAKNNKDVLISWENLSIVKQGRNTSLEIKSRESLCKIQKNMVLINKRLAYHEARGFCSQLGGTLSEDSLTNTTDLKMIGSESDICGNGLWVPIVQGPMRRDGNFQWMNDITGQLQSDILWRRGQPNGMLHQQCVYRKTGGQYVNKNYDFECNKEYCSICTLPEIQYFTLRGYMEKEKVETRYSLIWGSQTNASRINLEGTNKGYMVWNPESCYTSVHNDNDEVVLENFNCTPFGLLDWWLQENNATTHLKLVFTQCDEITMFTCDNGQCVDLDKRCDQFADCADASDEVDCSVVGPVNTDTYIKDFVPTTDKGTKLKVNVAFDLVNIVAISEKNLHMSLKLNVHLEWHDHRLTFVNLRDSWIHNMVPYGDTANFWIPPIIFGNTYRREQLHNRNSSIMVVLKKGNGVASPRKNPHEAKLYKGSENPFRLSNIVSNQFDCSFAMYLFPFDNQTCFVMLTIPPQLKDKIWLVPAEKVNYFGDTELQQYTLTATEATSPQPDEVRLVLSFRRHTTHYWLETFIPTMCLVIAAQVTLFIDQVHFEATVMVALTAALVMYTLYGSIASALPIDSKIKLIDIWLLHGLLMPFLVFLVLIFSKLQIQRGGHSGPISPNGRWKKNSSTQYEVSAVKDGGHEGTINGLHQKAKKRIRRQQLNWQVLKIGQFVLPTLSALFIFSFFAYAISQR